MSDKKVEENTVPEKDNPVSLKVKLKQSWPRMPLQYDSYGKLWIGNRDD